MSQANQRPEWPELVGKSVQEAKEVILSANPNYQIHVLPQGSIATCDYRTDRVRIFVDEETQTVVKYKPRVG